MAKDEKLRVGTSAFTAEGWEGTFYPAGKQARDYLSYYATQFDTVELDNTFYRTPALSTVQGWNAKTPEGFVFAAKVPQVITHEKMLVDCDEDLNHFLKTMEALGEKLGPLLFQFGYFNRTKFKSGAEFLARLAPFLAKLPKGFQYAVEIRNKSWIDARFLDLLRKHGVAFALIDQSWVPRPWEYAKGLDPITAEFTYVRWLGDRKGIEERTKTWNRTIVNREPEMEEWVRILRKASRRVGRAYVYANNHYAGYGPGTVKLFWEKWAEMKTGEKE